MKKVFMVVVTLVTLTSISFAKDPVNAVVLNSFNKTYVNASATSWTVTSEFIRVRFTWEGEILYAYYNPAGEQIAVTRNIKTSQLPIALASIIKTKYTEYFLSDLFEVSSDTGTNYYATVCKGNCTIILKASPSDTWTVYKRVKK